MSGDGRGWGSGMPGRLGGLLALGALGVAMLAGGAWLAFDQWLQAPERLAAEAEVLARVAASGVRPLVDGTRTALVALSLSAEVRRGDPSVCGPVMATVRQTAPALLDLGLVLGNGAVICSASSGVAPSPPREPAFVVATREARALVAIGDADPATGAPALVVAMPLDSTDGELRAFLYAAIDPAAVSRLLAEVPLAEGSSLALVDATGQAVARRPALAGPVAAGDPRVRALALGGATAVAGPDLDGVTRILAVSRLAGAPGPGLAVVAGLPPSGGPAGTGRRLLIALGLTLAVASGLLAAWIIARLALARERPERRGPGGLAGERALMQQVTDLVGQRAREVAFLGQLSGLLQVCVSIEEAAGVVQRLFQQFFPGESGALYIADPARSALERVTVWGPLASEAAPLFGPPDCWALRRGRPHVVEDVVAGLACPHLARGVPSAYLCVPLLAQGETLGLLHLSSGQPAGSPARRGTRPLWTDSKQRLMTTVPEQLGLALANLRLREKLRRESIRDALTGLFNRRYMEESLDIELARAQRALEPVGVLLIDVDHFKRYNDTFGHGGGDAVLTALGGLLRGGVRGGDLACRLGGEEFLLILPGAPLAELSARANAIREAVRALRVFHRGQPLDPVTVSIGVAAAPEHGTTREVLLRAADSALYRAKRAGRDQVAVPE